MQTIASRQKSTLEKRTNETVPWSVALISHVASPFVLLKAHYIYFFASLVFFYPNILVAEIGASSIEKDTSVRASAYRIGCVPRSDSVTVYNSPNFDDPSILDAFSGSMKDANFSADVRIILRFMNDSQFLGANIFNGRGAKIPASGECPLCHFNGHALWFLNAAEWDCRLHSL